MITKEDFVAWKLNPVTVGMFDVIKSRIDSVSERLVESAGIDPQFDRYLAGMARSFKEVISIEFDDVEDKQDA